MVANVLDKVRTAENKDSLFNVDGPTKTAKQASMDFLFESNKRSTKEEASERQISGNQRLQNPSQTAESPRFKNHLSSASYLFTNKNMGGNPALPEPTGQRRRTKKRDTGERGDHGDHVGNDALKHQNLLRSLKFLFGTQIVA